MSFLSNLFQSKARNVRSLENPVQRQPIRRDFPAVIQVGETHNSFDHDIKNGPFHVDKFLDVVGQQLELQGQQLSGIDNITIAYPHKARDWKGKPHEMASCAKSFAAALQSAMPNVNWIIADGLCETRHLNRSAPKSQDMVNTFRKKHRFDFIEAEQKTDLPFMHADHSGPSYFILFDDVFAQGTTAASMINFIHHNNGHVLAAASLHKQQNPASFHLHQCRFQYHKYPAYAFRNEAYNKGPISEIAEALSSYAWLSSELPKHHFNFHLEDYVEELDLALQNVGLSLPALTMGESELLVWYFRGNRIHHEKFIAALNQKSSLSGTVKAELRRWTL